MARTPQPFSDDLFGCRLAGCNVFAYDAPLVTGAGGALAGCAAIPTGMTQDLSSGHVTRVSKRRMLQYIRQDKRCGGVKTFPAAPAPLRPGLVHERENLAGDGLSLACRGRGMRRGVCGKQREERNQDEGGNFQSRTTNGCLAALRSIRPNGHPHGAMQAMASGD